MDRPRNSQDQIIDLLGKVQHRLKQGETVASVCKSLGASQSSYRRWRIKYGELAKEHAATGARSSTGQSSATPPTSTEDLLTNKVKASPSGKVPKFSVNAKDLLDAANDASSSARNAWLAFLVLLAYLLITLGGVSHKDLLLDDPVKLPIVNIDIPLFSFFLYAPALLLLFYLDLLIIHITLARKYREFLKMISPEEGKTKAEHPARLLVHSYGFSQLLAGPKANPIRTGLTRLIGYVTWTFLPIITLLYFQIKFLPYHEGWITYWHRIAVLLALVMLFLVVPLIHPSSRKPKIKIGPKGETWQLSSTEAALCALVALLIPSFSWLIATVPDERLDGVAATLVSPINPKAHSENATLSPHARSSDEKQLLNPIVRVVHERLLKKSSLPWLLSFRVLFVEDEDLVPDETDQQDEVSVVLRERDLRFARLNRSDLHRADLTNANLRGAQMRGTRLEKAKLQETNLKGADLSDANFGGASLKGADLSDANFGGANLKGADLSDANLGGASLNQD